MVHDARQHLPPVDTLHLHAASFKARGESKPVNESIELGSSISAAAKCEDEANSGLIYVVHLANAVSYTASFRFHYSLTYFG